jgi:hypothetical protein
MTIVTDPDNLDRFQVAVNPVDETISVRGLGTIRGAQSDVGTSNGTTTFSDSVTNDFVATSVAADDILTIVSGTDVGHYVVQSVDSTNDLTLDRAVDGTASNVTYKINVPEATGAVGEAVADGVTMQAVYSFLKEEWRTLAGSLGNAPDLVQFTFPFESITREQFEVGGATHSGWDFADNTTRNLMRTGGWQKLDSAGVVRADYTGVVTLGSLDADAQVYYQQHAVAIDPIDFVLTGTVNQAINTYDAVTAADAGTGFAITTSNTITRNDGLNWFTEGYRAGGQITIFTAEIGGNNGTYTISTVADATNGALVIVGTGLTNDAVDNSMQAAINKRSFLKLFVRKKARSYAGSEIADIGVTTIETLVNRFPLTHAVDAGISTDDGLLAGSASGTATVFGTTTAVATSSVSGGGEGTTDPVAGDGLFTFIHTGALFTSTNKVAVGDVITFEDKTLSGNTYEIQEVTDADTLVLFEEPGDAAVGTENAITYSTRTKYIVFPGNTDGVNANSTADDGLGEFTSATVGDFAAAGVAAGDYIRLTDGGTGGASNIGVYKISGVATTTLTVDITDNENWATGTGIDFEILEPGMFLQQKSVTATGFTASGGRTLTFADNDPDTLTASTGDFAADGWVHGMALTVTGTTNNNGTYIVDTVGTTVLTTIASEAFTAEGPLSSVATIAGEVGFVRTLNTVDYPFNWRLFGNGCTLNQAFEFIQKEMRQLVDVDESTGVERGDVADLLMSFASPTGTGLNLYIEDLVSTDINNATFQDITADARNFAFIAGVTITLNDNIINSISAKVVVFFTNNDAGDNDGSDFGTVNAIIVQDDQSANMEALDPSTDLSFNFDFDNNVQRGAGSGATTAPVTIVAIGTTIAQYVQVTGNILRQNNNTFALVAALERNYSNL